MAQVLNALLGERAFAPVDPSVGAEIGAMDVVGAAGEGAGGEPFFLLFGDAGAVDLGEFPDAGRTPI